MTTSRRRWNTIGFALVAITGLLLVAPFAQAASSGPATITLKAPYTGVTLYTSTSSSSSGCGAGKVVRAPAFDASNGVGVFSVKADASSCAPLYGDTGGASAGLTVYVPVPVYSGNNVIHAKWTIQATITTRLGGANCLLTNTTYSYCLSESYADFGAYAYLYDETNGSYWFGDSNWAGDYAFADLYDICFYGNCSLTLTPNVHLSIDVPVTYSIHASGLVPSHVYVLEVSFQAYASVEDSAYQGTLSGASEIASVSMTGPGLGATLDSITIR
ncbi:MAG: hypothetical protein WB809_00440 [Thermoplasmata archaeon]